MHIMHRAPGTVIPQPREREGSVCASCVGSLGLFGNSVFQLTFAHVLAAKHNLQLQVCTLMLRLREAECTVILSGAD
jgi:hypothetical protein